MATVVGDLILRGYEHAWRLEKTIEARTFASRRTSQGSRAEIRANDIILLSISLIILALKLKFTW
jgi:energy-coupling factor transporter transmembrane protein EcfT